MAFLSNSQNLQSTEIVKLNEQAITSVNEQENKMNKMQNLVTPKRKSSRLSILKSLDPYTSYLSDKSDNSPELNYCLDMKNVIAQPSSANKSFDLLKFDVSTTEESPFVDTSASLKSVTYDMFHNDFMPINNASPILDNMSNISKILDDSILENDDVATENLIGLSPIKRVVDRKHFDTLQQYHEKMKAEWREKEIYYENMIKEKKKDNEDKINDALSEYTENVEKMRYNCALEFKNKQLEYEEIEARLSGRHNEILAERESELKDMLRDLESLREEIFAQDSDRISDLITYDIYINMINEVIVANTADLDNLKMDARQLELTLSKYVSKIKKCEETLVILKENQKNLREAVDKYEEMIAEMKSKVEEKEKLINSTNEKNDDEYQSCMEAFQQKLKRLEVKIKHLECVENNLRTEIDLRVKERDEMTETLDELTMTDSM